MLKDHLEVTSLQRPIQEVTIHVNSIYIMQGLTNNKGKKMYIEKQTKTCIYNYTSNKGRTMFHWFI